jgi:hypothetical protein
MLIAVAVAARAVALAASVFANTQHGLLLHRTGGLSINLSRCDRPNSWHLSRVVEELLPKPVRLCSLVVSTPSRSMFKAMQTTQVGRIRGGSGHRHSPLSSGRTTAPSTTICLRRGR